MNEEYKKFLDKLRDSGDINMFAAGTNLQEEFGMTRHEARNVLKEWMDNYHE